MIAAVCSAQNCLAQRRNTLYTETSCGAQSAHFEEGLRLQRVRRAQSQLTQKANTSRTDPSHTTGHLFLLLLGFTVACCVVPWRGEGERWTEQHQGENAKSQGAMGGVVGGEMAQDGEHVYEQRCEFSTAKQRESVQGRKERLRKGERTRMWPMVGGSGG
jgi:hypothetical protein